jgi:DNA-binding transcriptional MerR regulator
MQSAGYSTDTVAQVTGASQRMIGDWVRSRLIRPSVHKGAGRGGRHRFSFGDVVAIKVIADLRKIRVSLQEIRAVVTHLQGATPGDEPSAAITRQTLLTDGKRVYVPTDQRQLMEVCSQQAVWAVPLSKMIADASKLLRGLPEEWTEDLRVDGKSFRLLIAREPGQNAFTVSCAQLPGLLVERATSADEALRCADEAIRTVLQHARARRTRRLQVQG